MSRALRLPDGAIGHGRALGSTSSSGIIASAELTSGEWHQTEGETLEQRKVHADPHRDGLFYVLHRAVGRRRVPGDIVVDWGSFQPYSIAVDPSPEATVLVGTADRIMRLRSADYSDTPTWEDPGSWSETPIAAIAFAPGAAGFAYAISQSGAVHHEPDVNRPSWGAWTQTGSWEITGVRALAVNAFDDRRVYAITGDQIARSPDRGATWIRIAGSDLGALPDSPLHSVLADPRADEPTAAADAAAGEPPSGPAGLRQQHPSAAPGQRRPPGRRPPRGHRPREPLPSLR